MMREKRWTKAQREREREREREGHRYKDRERESGVLFIVMHRNIFIGKNESVDERSGWDPSTLVERRTHSPPPPSFPFSRREGKFFCFRQTRRSWDPRDTNKLCGRVIAHSGHKRNSPDPTNERSVQQPSPALKQGPQSTWKASG
jgi:hypothetical protein